MSMSVTGKAPNQQFVEGVKNVWCHVANFFVGHQEYSPYKYHYPSGCEEVLSPIVSDEPLEHPLVWMAQVSSYQLEAVASFLGIESWEMVDRAANGDIFLNPRDESEISYVGSTPYGEDVVWGQFNREGAQHHIRLWGCGGAPSIREYYDRDASWRQSITDDQIAIVKGALLLLGDQPIETSVDEKYGPLIRDLALLLS